MGATGWIYYGEFDPDPRVVLKSLHERELAGGEYYWSADGIPRPKTVQEMLELYGEHEYLTEEGTHSVLDVLEVSTATRDVVWAIRPLTDAEMLEKFGTTTPSREQFDASYRVDPLDDFERWSGRFTTLYEHGVPTKTVVWGISGD